MKTVSIKELSQGGASRVVREAQREPVLISKNNEPAAWVLSSAELAEAQT
ncbi:MAG: type II toxin-antitoxin system prevent-host-death family antitoxin [Chloroflexi bacterium]|nr:type II toxin-antitoxin system prevent-host-death family antitoxin [Chloroflexota bacterium]